MAKQEMKFKYYIAPAIILSLFCGCATISESSRIEFPAKEGKLIPKEVALEFVLSNLDGAGDKGVMLFSVEGSSIQKLAVEYSYKGGKTRHYGYYGLTVEVREYKWPAEKGKPFALIINGTAGPDTFPGRRIYWFETSATAKDLATALIALGAKPIP